MIIGLPILDSRIAPVFDVARELLLVKVDNGIVRQQELLVLPEVAEAKISKLVESGVKVLLCGAISNELKNSAKQGDIEVVSFLSGDVRCVVKAWLANSLNDVAFAMPGCKRRAGRRNGYQRCFRHGKGQCRR